ncbi:MAG: NADH-quinone oxidoreductase subunit L, partial [Acidimicrobiia bacterium]|nr:NADH-quinone oxidoreductase subunit L [Acidimicrobiia bacterium]
MDDVIANLSSVLYRFAEEGEKVPTPAEITSGWAVENAWIILVLPFVAAGLIALLGGNDEKWGHRLAVGTMGYVFLHSAWIWFLQITQGVLYEKSIVIAEIGSGWGLEWGWVVDGLSSMMYFVVGTVSLLVFIYAVGYMKGEVRYAGFFSAFTMFAGAMLVLVASPNLAQLIVGWELVGVASYLLIGHYWEDKENSSAGMKAFFTNKVADVGLIIGAIVLAAAVGTFEISEILYAATHESEALSGVAVGGAILLFIGAMGKSAQFPLHVWLPDAMAGPTPVSALMHAATMVTAGVYLIGRMFPLYEAMAGPEAQQYVMWIGAITLVLTGLLALVQRDIKKVLAYSTLSQLGYMVTALGAGAYTAGLFHLFTHAFFKALLFLGAGSAIHAVHSNDMHDMGGLRKFMPRTYTTFVIASLALAGIIPLSGYWSKDEILVGLNHAPEGLAAQANFVLWVATIGAFITAFYMTRTIALTFFGQYKGHGEPHESPKLMTYPLIALAGFSVVVGWINIPGVTDFFTKALEVRFLAPGDHHAESLNYGLAAIGTLAAVGG